MEKYYLNKNKDKDLGLFMILAFISIIFLSNITRAEITFNKTNVSSPGGSDGTASVIVNGSPPFTYFWTHSGETTQSVGGLSAGTYSVEITDNDLCMGIGTVTILDPFLTCVWTGAIDVDWDKSGNWSTSTVPVGVNAQIPSIGVVNFPLIFGSASVNDLTISSGAYLSIAPQGSLTTYGLLTNDGNFFIFSDGIVIPGVGRSGSYIDKGGMAGSGIFDFERDITNFSASNDPSGWHFLSSPIDGFTSDGIYGYFLNLWNRSTSRWIHHEAPPPAPPCTPAPQIPLNSMVGWSIKYDPTFDIKCPPGGVGTLINMMGAPGIKFHSGSQSIAFGYNSGYLQNWNLLGNPYPSSIDPNQIVWDPNMVQAIYMWDGWANTYRLGAFGLGNNIPPTQGFFIDAIGPGTLSFSGNERIHDPNQFWWKSTPSLSNFLIIKVSTQNLRYYDETYIRFDENSSAGFEKRGDARKLLSITAESPQIYTNIPGEIMALNTQPETDKIPMSFICSKSEKYNIEAIATPEFHNILLEDKVTGIITDMLTNSYTFNYKAGDDENRFVIHFGDISTENENGGFVIYSSQGNIVVYNINNQVGDAYVYNIVGQLLGSVSLQDGINNITLDNAQGYYIVNVRTSENVVNKKVYIH